MSQSKVISFNAFNLTLNKVYISHYNLSLRESVSWKHDEVGNFKIKEEIINYINESCTRIAVIAQLISSSVIFYSNMLFYLLFYFLL